MKSQSPSSSLAPSEATVALTPAADSSAESRRRASILRGRAPVRRELVCLFGGEDLTAALQRLEGTGLELASIGDLDVALHRLRRRATAAIIVDLRRPDVAATADDLLAEIARGREGTAVVALVDDDDGLGLPRNSRHVCDALIGVGDLSEDRLAFALERALERRRVDAELTAARRDLMLSEANLLLMLISDRAPIILVDEDHTVVFANREAARVTGQPMRSMCGRGVPPAFAAAMAGVHDGAGPGERTTYDILWNRKPATLVVLREGDDGECWREVQGRTAVVQAHIEHAADGLGKLRHLLQMSAQPELVGDVVHEVIGGLARDLLGARATLAGLAERSSALRRELVAAAD